MIRDFYEQLGAKPDHDLEELRTAYKEAVVHSLRRREAMVASGGDPASIDLARACLDEAWDTLRDPIRRRRYDAMLAVVGEGVIDVDVDELWERVAGAMIPPSVAAAVRIVLAETDLKLPPLPDPPRIERLAPPMDEWNDPEPASPKPHAPRHVSFDFANDGDDLDPFSGLVTPSDRTTPTGVPDAFGEPITHADTPIRVTLPAPRMPSSMDIQQEIERHGYSGALIATLRERQGLSYADLSARTSITAAYFEAIEREDLTALPSGEAYVRSYLRKIAELLGVPIEPLVEGYLRRTRDEK